MNKFEFTPGDKVFHKSDSTVIWIIEKIENDEAYCSTLSEAKELKKEKFMLSTIEKIDEEGNVRISWGNTQNRHRY